MGRFSGWELTEVWFSLVMWESRSSAENEEEKGSVQQSEKVAEGVKYSLSRVH